MSNSDSFSELEDDEEDPKFLAYIQQTSESEYTIEPKDDNQPLNNRIWLVVRSLKFNSSQASYTIQPNDVIKVGRVSLRVTELNTTFHEPNALIEDEFDDIVTLVDEPQNDDACKFCWSNEEDDENPKLCP